MEIENIVSEFVTVIKEGKILKVRENTELYRGRNRDVLEVECIELENIAFLKGNDMKVYKKTFDMAIITVGTIPATRFIKKAGINVDKNDFVTVDKHMKTNIDNIYAIRRYCKS